MFAILSSAWATTTGTLVGPEGKYSMGKVSFVLKTRRRMNSKGIELGASNLSTNISPIFIKIYYDSQP